MSRPNPYLLTCGYKILGHGAVQKKDGLFGIGVSKVDCPISHKDWFVITSYLNYQKCNHSRLYGQPLGPSLHGLNLKVICG
jgi:hypothetical protein